MYKKNRTASLTSGEETISHCLNSCSDSAQISTPAEQRRYLGYRELSGELRRHGSVRVVVFDLAGDGQLIAHQLHREVLRLIVADFHPHLVLFGVVFHLQQLRTKHS